MANCNCHSGTQKCCLCSACLLPLCLFPFSLSACLPACLSLSPPVSLSACLQVIKTFCPPLGSCHKCICICRRRRRRRCLTRLPRILRIRRVCQARRSCVSPFACLPACLSRVSLCVSVPVCVCNFHLTPWRAFNSFSRVDANKNKKKKRKKKWKKEATNILKLCLPLLLAFCSLAHSLSCLCCELCFVLLPSPCYPSPSPASGLPPSTVSQSPRRGLSAAFNTKLFNASRSKQKLPRPCHSPTFPSPTLAEA